MNYSLKYWPNKITTETKEIILDNKIITLIWENGSWKSAILEQIFDNYFNDDEKIIISYSSWLNESFSSILNLFTEKSKKLTLAWIPEWYNENTINSFYFNKSWWKILIFLAYSLKNNMNNEKTKFLWNVKAFLNEDKNKYLLKNEPLLQFHINIQKAYINKLNDSEWEDKSLETSDFHNMLDKLVNNIQLGTLWTNKEWYKWLLIKETKNEYDFSKASKITSMILKPEDTKNIFTNDKNKILYFLWLLTNKSYFLNTNDIKLYFNNWALELNDLSDWEFQLLVIYALIDLFDWDNTIFLFDEIDSHLHYSNISNLWDKLKNIKWNIITTTHIWESIVNNNFNNLLYIENWLINNSLTAPEIIKKLWNLTNQIKFEYQVAWTIENLVLIDDDVDWIVFKKLVKKKLWNNSYLKLENITSYKRTSSYNDTNEAFWKSKLIYVKDFIDANKWKPIKTKNIFLICDRDKLPLTEIKEDLQVNINSDYRSIKSFWKTKTYLLSWKRLEIENYLLHKQLLIDNNCFPDYSYNSNFKLDNKEDIAILDCKDITHPLYKKEWFNEKELDNLIKNIPIDEISDDIEKMYNFIIDKI